MGRTDSCRHHRDTLLDFLEQREHGPSSAAALAHLDRCRSCEAELGATLLTIHALRRVLGEAARVDPPADGWDRLRTRVQRPVAGVWQARTAVAGLAVSAALVTALVGPATVFRPQGVVEDEPGPAAAVLNARTVADQEAESAFLGRVRLERPKPSTVPVVDLGTVQWRGPDGLGKPQAHVSDEVPTRAD
jgi:hypothetical protein